MGEETEPTTVAEGVTADESAKDHRRKRKKLLHKSLLELMEFYLGDVNLAHDKFLNSRIQGKPFVYLDLSTFLTFNRIKALTTDIKDLAKSVKQSEFLKLSEDETQVCRTTEIKEKENEEDCTIYVEQLGPDVNHDILTKVFSEFGHVDYISIPRFSHNGKFKGFAFVEFRDPDCAKKALEVLSARGCCLSPHMAPEELVSIKSFDKDGQNKEGSGANENSNKKKNKRKHPGDEDKKQSTDDEPKKSDEEEEPHKKKLKTEIKGTNTAETKQPENKEKCNSQNRKRKLSSNGNLSDKVKADCEETSDEHLEPSKKKIKSDTEGASETEEEAADNSAKQQKKRKRKKKMKKDKVTASSLGLRVLSKREWKQLRNKYLNMQREVMTKLKQQLYRPRPEARGPNVEEKIQPGTVIKVTLEEPIINATASSKNEFRVHPDICYIDAKEGSSCVYLRTTSPDFAVSLVQTKHWPNMEILQGEEETAYWDRIKKDRLEYFQQKSKRHQRGRTKLLKRAEKFQEKQI